jgi:hypothetical protein
MREALARLASDLRSDPVIAPHVADSDEPPALGILAASGPRAEADPAAYTLLFEAIREGYLLHYGRSRLLAAADPDLRLLAGDYLYALGLERLAARGDLEAVRELGDLISLSAQVHARDGDDASAADAVAPLWLASAAAVGSGAEDRLERGKSALREGGPDAAALLREAAREGVTGAQRDALAAAAESIGLDSQHFSDRG